MKTILPNSINQALIFSAKAHRSQLRKSTDIPYISHPAAVGMILLKAGCRDELVVAGILHDCLEDTEVKEKDILNAFGAEVLELVKGTSEPAHRSQSWSKRKQYTIEYLKNASHDVKMVSCADKLHNVMCILNDFRNLGEKVWDRFNAPMQSQVWYYSELADSFRFNAPREVLFKNFADTVDELIAAIRAHSKKRILPSHKTWKAKIQPGKVHAFMVVVRGDDIDYECENFGSKETAQRFADWINGGMTKSTLGDRATLNVARMIRHNILLPD